jgi:hypothetical protein
MSVAIRLAAGWTVGGSNPGEFFYVLQTDPDSHQTPIWWFTVFSGDKTAREWC